MSSPTPTSTPPASAAAATGERPDAPQAGAPAPSIGAAVHADLWKVAPDPAAQQASLRAQARTLGLAFFGFFTLVIGGLSLSLNGLWSGGRVALFAATVADGHEVRVRLEDGPPALVLDDGQRLAPSHVDYVARPADDPPPAAVRGLTRVRVVEEHKVPGGRTSVREDFAWLHATLPAGRTVARVAFRGWEEEAAAPCVHAWREARLLGVLPTRYAMVLGVVMGALGLVVPAALVPFYRFWMRYVAAPLGWFNTRLILSVVFYALFSPIALVLALKRRLKPETDALRRASSPPGASYWLRREKQRPRNHFERLF